MRFPKSKKPSKIELSKNKPDLNIEILENEKVEKNPDENSQGLDKAESSEQENLETAQNRKKLKIYNHEKMWGVRSEFVGVIDEIDEEVDEAYSNLLLWPLLTVAIVEFLELEIMGVNSILDFLFSLASDLSPIGPAGIPILFTSLLIVRSVLLDPIRKVGASCVYRGVIKPRYENIRLDLSNLHQLYLENAPKEKKNEGLALYKEHHGQLVTLLQGSKNLLYLLGFVVFLLCGINYRRISTSLLLNSLFPFAQAINSYFNKEKKISPEHYLKILSTIFKEGKFKIEQAQYKSGKKNKVVNLFFLQYPSKKEGAIISFLQKNNSAFTIIAKTDQGLIFDIANAVKLQHLDFPLDLSSQKIMPPIKKNHFKVDSSQSVEISVSTETAPEKSSSAVAPRTDKKKGTMGLRKAGAAVQLEPEYQKRRAVSQTAPAAVKKSSSSQTEAAVEIKSSSLPPKPMWLITYERACKEIIETNNSNGTDPFLFTYGSAVKYIRKRSEILLASDIDLRIFLLKTQRFKFPADLEPQGNFSPENNVSCRYGELIIDITVEYVTTINPQKIIEKFLEGVDLSHLGDLIPYDDNIPFTASDHTQACINEEILSAKPRKARDSFINNPFRFYRALAVLLSGNPRVDQDMRETLDDVKFCVEISTKHSPIKNCLGINKLLSKAAHPALVLTELKKFGWLDLYFPEAAKIFDLTLARVHFVYTALLHANLEKNVAPIYALLLWPSFSQGNFYTCHFFRAQNFFQLKTEAGISFPNEPKDSCLQTKISLLLYWLSRDISDFRNAETIDFSLTLIMQYTIYRSILREAFTNTDLKPVDLAALLKESIYKGREPSLPTDPETLRIVGPINDYFKST